MFSSRKISFLSVGAGSAGAVVASRLSEDAWSSVLLLEAGGNDLDNVFMNTPALTDKTVMTHLDWQYFTVPQKHAVFAMQNNVRISLKMLFNWHCIKLSA